MIIGNCVAILRDKFTASIGLPFAEILGEDEIEPRLAIRHQRLVSRLCAWQMLDCFTSVPYLLSQKNVRLHSSLDLQSIINVAH